MGIVVSVVGADRLGRTMAGQSRTTVGPHGHGTRRWRRGQADRHGTSSMSPGTRGRDEDHHPRQRQPMTPGDTQQSRPGRGMPVWPPNAHGGKGDRGARLGWGRWDRRSKGVRTGLDPGRQSPAAHSGRDHRPQDHPTTDGGTEVVEATHASNHPQRYVAWEGGGGIGLAVRGWDRGWSVGNGKKGLRGQPLSSACSHGKPGHPQRHGRRQLGQR